MIRFLKGRRCRAHGREDIGNYYAAQPTAVAVNDNLYKLYLKPGDKVGARAECCEEPRRIEALILIILCAQARRLRR